MPLFAILVLAALGWAGVSFLMVVNHLAKDMIYYWEAGDDYTPAMRADALGAIVVPAIFWPITFSWRGLILSIDRASYWLALRSFGKGGASYVGKH